MRIKRSARAKKNDSGDSVGGESLHSVSIAPHKWSWALDKNSLLSNYYLFWMRNLLSLSPFIRLRPLTDSLNSLRNLDNSFFLSVFNASNALK
jgi:hypothetical protein